MSITDTKFSFPAAEGIMVTAEARKINEVHKGGRIVAFMDCEVFSPEFNQVTFNT